MNSEDSIIKENTTRITFESKDQTSAVPSITLSGISLDECGRIEKIKKLMDLLELPEGTNARVIYTGSDVIVR